MTSLTPRNGVLNITPYKVGDAKIDGFDTVIKLASNESPLGPSPRAVEAAQNVVGGNMALYPDPNCTALKAAIGEVHGLDPAQIICAGGSEELLYLTAKAYAADGDEIIMSQYGFIAYPIAANSVGATLVRAPEDNYTTSVDAVLGAVTDRTKIVFLANPNNPTGTYISRSEVDRLRAGLRDDILLVLDAAYAEYATAEDFDAGLHLLENGAENTIVTRTFSKIYGLASCRVGWAYCPPSVMDILNRVRGTFNVSAVSQAAALGAVKDQDHVAKAKAHNQKWLAQMGDALKDMGLLPLESLGNFLLVRFPGGAEQAAAADQYLRGKGIIVRPVGNYDLAEFLRITIGTDRENDALINALREFIN